MARLGDDAKKTRDGDVLRPADGEGGARAERALRILDQQIGYMATLVEDLLHASQVMRGAVSLECEPVDVGQLVRQAAEFIEAGVAERGQRLTSSPCRSPRNHLKPGRLPLPRRPCRRSMRERRPSPHGGSPIGCVGAGLRRWPTSHPSALAAESGSWRCDGFSRHMWRQCAPL